MREISAITSPTEALVMASFCDLQVSAISLVVSAIADEGVSFFLPFFSAPIFFFLFCPLVWLTTPCETFKLTFANSVVAPTLASSLSPEPSSTPKPRFFRHGRYTSLSSSLSE
ncbi:L10-interacting MYB domain-containing protein [Trifolium repens]|nr:L10-interacting MYB domain-containing protein [Trifolium repens]